MITVIDLETTGLLESEGNDISIQPHIIEIYAAQFSESRIVNEIDTFVKPPIPVSKHITKITGITDYDVKSAPLFVEIFKDIVKVFFKSHTLVAHNLSFDQNILINELKRIGKEYHMPYPPIKFCTIEQSMHIRGYRLKNNELYKIATGKDINGAHRSKSDALATYESYKWLTKNE